MTRIYLVRHGQTLWNSSARYQGHADVGLSDIGREQARALSKRLAKEAINAIYSSDLKRALETASILAEPHNLPVQALPELREINFGAWEGLTFDEIKAKYPELAERWHKLPATVRIPGGETFEEVKERAYSIILKLVQKHDPGAIVVVTHGGTIRAIICALLEIDLNHAFHIRQDNGSLNIIEFYEDWGILCLLNDTTHITSQ